MAKWNHYVAGADLEALAYRAEQAEDDPRSDPYTLGNRKKMGLASKMQPVNQGVLVGSYASVARMLDELAAVPGVEGTMLTFDEFVTGMENFGTRILPLMRCRETFMASA